ncbi:TetR/AcrR family transcriptional regulator [Pseudonocardia pini]|uniref:TetR/AcrR family transcriptional regulator n=1 Tax=Pseudonocardia pini TaxID=2758030 RepID=UPI0015F0080B|nr:TetR/AcrR family transcriptional regulator [Pseudonocardia pini]
MGAAVESERDRLLGLVAGYVLEHGIAELTLRKLGAAIGTNNRMLLYYFASKERLIEEALLAASHRFPVFAAAMAGFAGPEPLGERLDRCWAGIAAAENHPFHRLFFEVYGVALHQPGRFDQFLARVGRDWTNLVVGQLRAEGVPEPEAGLIGREIVALWRGLQFDLLSTGEAAEVAQTHSAAAAGFAERCARARAAQPAGRPAFTMSSTRSGTATAEVVQPQIE